MTKREHAKNAARIIISHLFDNKYVNSLFFEDEEEIREFMTDVIFSAHDFEVIEEYKEREDESLDFGPSSEYAGHLERERNAISFIASLVGQDGGKPIDSLEGWCQRLADKMKQLEQLTQR